MRLYDAFLKNKEIVLEEYQKVLSKMPHLPLPISYAIGELASGKDVTYSDFLVKVKEYIE